jgi:hypothetical protein
MPLWPDNQYLRNGQKKEMAESTSISEMGRKRRWQNPPVSPKWAEKGDGRIPSVPSDL